MRSQSKVLRLLAWSTIGEWASKVAQPLLFVVLARLIAPQHFGIAAGAAMVVSLFNVAWEAGLSRALVQCSGDVDRIASAIFKVSALAAAVITAAVVAGSDALATLVLGDAGAAPAFAAAAVNIFLVAIASVPTALLQRELRFDRLLVVRVAGIASQVAVAVPMAAMGADWWALIAASVVSQAVQVVALWRSCPWRPVRGVELAVLQPLWRFGGWSFAGSLLVWLYCWADMAALAHAQGPAAVGVYRAGNQLVDAVFAMIVSPLLPVLFGYFSSIKADTARIVDRVVHVQFMLTAVAVPVGIGLFLFADLVMPILGARWSEAAAVIAVVGLAHGLSWSMGANNEAFKAIGRPDVQPKIMALSLLYFIPVYYAVAPHGLLALAWAKFCLFVGSQVWDLLALRFLLGVPLMQSLRRLAPVFLAAVTYTTIYVQAAALLPGDGLVLGPLLFAALVLGANVVLFRRSLAARTWPWRLDAPVAN